MGPIMLDDLLEEKCAEQISTNVDLKAEKRNCECLRHFVSSCEAVGSSDSDNSL